MHILALLAILILVGLVSADDPIGSVSLDAQASSSAVQERYFLYDVKIGEGFNLQKEVFVRVASVVQQLNQADADLHHYTLVLPPWCVLAHWHGHSEAQSWAQFFDVDAMSSQFPILPYDEYVRIVGRHHVDVALPLTFWHQTGRVSGPKWEFTDIEVCEAETGSPRFHRVRDNSAVSFSGHCDELTVSEFKCIRAFGMSADEMVKAIQQDSELSTARSILLKHADGLSIPLDPRQFWSFRKLLVFASDLHHQATSFIDSELGGSDSGQFVATHIRKRDFVRAHPKSVPSNEFIIARLDFLKQHFGAEFVFVLTDAHRADKDAWSDGVSGLRFFNVDLGHPGRNAIVEQIIGARARFFQGVEVSRFSMSVQEDRDLAGTNHDGLWNVWCESDKPPEKFCTKRPFLPFSDQY